MNICRNCGCVIPEGKEYCPYCGQKADVMDEYKQTRVNSFENKTARSITSKISDILSIISSCIVALPLTFLVIMFIICCISPESARPMKNGAFDSVTNFFSEIAIVSVVTLIAAVILQFISRKCEDEDDKSKISITKLIIALVLYSLFFCMLFIVGYFYGLSVFDGLYGL